MQYFFIVLLKNAKKSAGIVTEKHHIAAYSPVPKYSILENIFKITANSKKPKLIILALVKNGIQNSNKNIFSRKNSYLSVLNLYPI